jgi:serine protease
LEEAIPYGIEMVNARLVDASKVTNRKICIIDSGYDLGHPDLQSAKVNGTTHGSLPPWDQDGESHGTHVAGTIAAIGGNDKGVIGVVPNGMMPLYISRAIDDNNNYFNSDLIYALYSCISEGANIINMSLGGDPSQIIKDICDDFYENRGVLLVAAAMNSGGSSYFYPASYDSVMSVAAVDSNKQHAWFSQYNDQVDIAGPGVSVLSTIPLDLSPDADSPYSSKSGTSSKSLVIHHGIKSFD